MTAYRYMTSAGLHISTSKWSRIRKWWHKSIGFYQGIDFIMITILDLFFKWYRYSNDYIFHKRITPVILEYSIQPRGNLLAFFWRFSHLNYFRSNWRKDFARAQNICSIILGTTSVKKAIAWSTGFRKIGKQNSINWHVSSKTCFLTDMFPNRHR